ncbi:MAG TPA: SIMPL domain-containing protein [Verrucomicrobiae bacterium]|nr:SIMPL domain-containing protein [Verrucomicrobiae bacterium]
METKNTLNHSQIIILGLCLFAASVLSTVILSRTLVQIKKFSQEVITVTGSAETQIVSDDAVWRCEFWRRDPAMTQAFALVRGDLKEVQEYLLSKGVKPEEITVEQASTSTIYRKNEKGNDTNDIEGYQILQSLAVRSRGVGKIAELSRISTELIDKGIQFTSLQPEYFYTGLAGLKLEMLARATENARERAENMAQATGNKIGFMRSAKMGVFQITPVTSYEISDWGTNDTSSLEKKVTAVVNVSFAIAS